MKKRTLLALLCASVILLSGVFVACSPSETTYTITYTAGSESAQGSAPEHGALTEGDVFSTAKNTFTLNGYAFAGWSDGTKVYEVGDSVTVGTSNITLTATWISLAKSVTYVSGNSAATGTAPVQADLLEGETFTLAENTFTLDGYVFAGWSDGESVYEAGDTYTLPAENVILTAQWDKVYTYEKGAHFTANRTFDYIDVDENGNFKLTFAKSTYPLETEEYVYSYSIIGSKVIFTDVLKDGSTETPGIYEGINYDGIILITLPTAGQYTGPEMDFTFLAPDIEGADFMKVIAPNPYGLEYAIDMYSGTGMNINAFNNGMMRVTMMAKTTYGTTVSFENGLYTYEINGVRNTVRLQKSTSSALIIFDDGFGGTYTVSGGAKTRSVVLDGYMQCTVDGAVGNYYSLGNGKFYVVDEDDNSFTITVDKENGEAIEKAVTAFTKTKTMIDGEENTTAKAMFAKLYYDGSTLFIADTSGGYGMPFSALVESDGFYFYSNYTSGVSVKREYSTPVTFTVRYYVAPSPYIDPPPPSGNFVETYAPAV